MEAASVRKRQEEVRVPDKGGERQMANTQSQSCPAPPERTNGNKENKESTKNLNNQPNVFFGNDQTVKISYHQNHKKFGAACHTMQTH